MVDGYLMRESEQHETTDDEAILIYSNYFLIWGGTVGDKIKSQYQTLQRAIVLLCTCTYLPADAGVSPAEDVLGQR